MLSCNKAYFCVVVLAAFPAVMLGAPPTLVNGGVVNSASYSPGVTPGAWISIFGFNLASSTALVGNADLSTGNLPTTFRGTSVTINGKAAFVDYVSPTQINVESPADTTTGPVQIVVTTAEGTANTTAISSNFMPAVFTLGTYAAVVRPSDSTIINGTGATASGYTTAASARPGDVVELFANGLGATTISVNPGTVFTASYPTASPSKVMIGGKNAEVSYSGLVGPGLYQINITMPDLPAGTYPVVITQNGISSPPTAYLNVSPTTALSTGVTLVSSAASTTAGAPVTLTATVAPSSSAGTITFYEGPVPIGTGTLVSGTATLSTALSTGAHTITAVFGDAYASNGPTTGAVSSGNAFASVATVVTVTPPSTSGCTLSTGSAQILCLANAFLTALSSTQQTDVQYPFALANVTRWTNLPVGLVSRNGLKLGDLSAAQQTAAFAVIQAAISLEGQERFQEIRGADQVISPLNAMFQWGAGNYYLSFYGTPSVTSPWMLQISGHHYALNHTFNSKYTSGTPYFIGNEPPIYTVHNTNYDPLAKQVAAMYALNQTLLSNSSSKLGGTFDDVVVGPDQGGGGPGSGGPGGGAGAVTFPRIYPTGTAGRGVLASTLSTDQQTLVRRAIEAWVGDIDPATANELLSIYESNDALNNTYIGYSGTGSVITVGDYIRIDGPRVWIEIVVQSSVAYRNSYHHHSIWRDKTADYGGEFGSSQ